MISTSRLLLCVLLVVATTITSTIGAPTTIYSINCGGPSFRDSKGKWWTSDASLVGSGAFGHKTLYSPRPVFNTDNVHMYLSERWCSDCTADKPLTYTLNVQNGEYTVHYHFVQFKDQGQQFTVQMNGANMAVDLSGETVSTAVVKSQDVTVTNGKLTISLMTSGAMIKAKVSAIEVILNDEIIPEPTVIPSPPPADPCATCPNACCAQQCFNPDTHQCNNGQIVEKPQQDRFEGVSAYYSDYRELGDNMVNFPVNLKKPVLGFIETGEFNKPQDYTLYRNSPWENYFAVRYYFYLTVPETGTYTFWSRSNDGTILYIDGVQVLNNDYNHDVEAEDRAWGRVELTAGTHKVQYDFYQSMHRSGLTFKWIRPGQTQEEFVPASAFTYARSELRPVIMSSDVNTGATGSTVTLTGFGFVFPASQTTVKFGDNVATGVTVLSDDKIQVVVPPGSGAVGITVQTPNDLSNSLQFNYN